MSFIPLTDVGVATGALATAYEDARRSFGFVPDAVRAFSPRPEVASVMSAMRRVVLGDASTIGKRRADLIGTAVSGINHCEYCGTAHAGLLAQRGDLDMDQAVMVYKNWRKAGLDPADEAMLSFAEDLTLTPNSITEDHIRSLRSHGFDDVNIFDIVLLTAYRNFMNRINDGLGISTELLNDRFGDDLVAAIGSV